eukprot:CAMPEP_0181238852 /NCGR_PEP_ID=MMETSP1096-20121128/39585_1 /TAXON_ID=156174 ORGANISM="Chrysochromulina ericina, Strain CCMP281" /NCGR_SAMPLE_ID=MMETSP1096 /ASSEMBLY_ACC=CAM_ASM_000453 /LENGTH=98 /DNA_ID=CAMNT_0023334437 /DNA_START=157 /DNA_END=453 /DNA_ORIENTATION=-
MEPCDGHSRPPLGLSVVTREFDGEGTCAPPERPLLLLCSVHAQSHKRRARRRINNVLKNKHTVTLCQCLTWRCYAPSTRAKFHLMPTLLCRDQPHRKR